MPPPLATHGRKNSILLLQIPILNLGEVPKAEGVLLALPSHYQNLGRGNRAPTYHITQIPRWNVHN
jgi:hypothetical protein